MSPLGHSRRSDRATFTSGLPRLADIHRVGRHVSNVPGAEVDASGGLLGVARSMVPFAMLIHNSESGAAQMPFVSVTRLRVRAWRYLPILLVQTFRSAWQAKSAKHCPSASVLRDAHRTFWTKTVWMDAPAMKCFMLSGVHRQVMPSLLEWCDEASVIDWVQDLLEPPSWEEAHRRMQHDGRSSKVNHPSEAHRRFEIPAPFVRPTGELPFK